jgi:hypothetical protein
MGLYEERVGNSGLEPLISDGLAPSGVTFDKDPSIISRIVHSPHVGSVLQSWRRQEDQWAMAQPCQD